MSDISPYDLEGMHSHLNKEIKATRTTIENLNEVIKAKDVEIAELKGENETIRALVESTEKELQWNFAENKRLKGEVERLTKAVEFAQYMKTDAEELLLAQEHLNVMCGEDGQTHDSDDVCDAEQIVSEHTRSLRSSIYEFTKRIFQKAGGSHE